MNDRVSQNGMLVVTVRQDFLAFLIRFEQFYSLLTIAEYAPELGAEHAQHAHT